MAKKKATASASLNAADLKHYQDTETYVNQVKILYKRAIDEIAKLVAANPDLLGQDDFSFSKTPALEKRVDNVIQELSKSITAVIDRGDRREWIGACAKSDKFIQSVLNTSKLTKDELERYQDRNLEQLAAFQERKINGLGLSERVWNYVATMKDEAELAIDTSHVINSQGNLQKIEEGMGKGKSAAELSRDIRSCLREPNKLFRRVRDKHGNLVLSKAAKLYHPGQGVYRSSYKNAMRLTRSEINMAYRQSDHMRWNQLDFVVGMQIALSNNHTIEGPDGKSRVVLVDICDELVGKYPKDFKFVGWHPQCKCHATPILKSLDELDKEIDEDGNYKDFPAAEEVTEAPANFNAYITANADRIAGWQSTPYYIKDNPQFVDKAIHPEKYVKKSLVLNEEQAVLMSELEMYGYNHSGSKKFIAALDDAKKAILAGDQEAYDKAVEIMQFTKKTNERIQAYNAKKKEEHVLTREEKIQEAAKKRHEARTADKEKELKEFAKKHAEKTDKAYAQIQQTINKLSNIRDIDVVESIDMMNAKNGVVLASGKVAGFSVEKQLAKAKEMEAKYASLVKDATKMQDLIPDAVDALQEFTLDEIKNSYKTIKSEFKTIEKMSLQTQERIINNVISAAPNRLIKSAMEARLVEVKIDIKIEALNPTLTNFQGLTTNTTVMSWKSAVDEAAAAIASRDVTRAEELLTKATQMRFAAEKYDQLKATGYSTKKFDELMQQTIDALYKGDIKTANLRIVEAEKVKTRNEANNARRAANKGDKKTEDETKEEKQDKKPGEAVGIKEVREVMGKELPYLLDNYEESVKRMQYTKDDYIKDHERIERAFKQFFDESNFSHCTSSDLLDERILDNGIITNLQQHELSYGRKYEDRAGQYDQERRTYGHFAYNKNNTIDITKEDFDGGGRVKFTSVIPKKDRLGDGDYYRCGVPVPKDMTEAYKDYSSGYGDAQIILRKENIVTTFTYENSLCKHTIPSLTSEPKVCSIDKLDFSALTSSGKLSRTKVQAEAGYIEIQYLPKRSEGKLLPKDMQSITLPRHPLKIHEQRIWDRWKKEGVDIYYLDRSTGKVVLFQKGDPLISKEEAEKFAKDVQSKMAEMTTADITKDKFEEVQKLLDKGKIMDAYDKAKTIKDTYDANMTELESFKKYIPDAKDWNKKFTIEEIRQANTDIEKQMKWMETSYADRNDPDKLIAKWARNASYVKNPQLADPSKQAKNTWEILYNAYNRKRDELIYKYRKDSIERSIADVQAFKTKDKEYKSLLEKLEESKKAGRWGNVEELIQEAKQKIIDLSGPATGPKLKLGESSSVVFKDDDFSQARKDAAKWFAAKTKSAAAMRKAFKEADDYMSQYAEDMWKKLTEEEKHVLWLYTDGSKYISEEMLGKYVFRMRSWIDKSYRNGLEDANLITSIIEKAPRLKDDIWMQSGKSENAFKAMFGVDISGTNLNKLVGREGTSEIFMSCHSARDGAFTKNTSTGSANNVVLSIYMPKGTKGAYLEPFASYGDSRRGADGLKWTGEKRQEAPSDQVEYLLQRGSKFRITKATYDPDTGKYYVDVELVSQESRAALSTRIKGTSLSDRPVRYKAPNS